MPVPRMARRHTRITSPRAPLRVNHGPANVPAPMRGAAGLVHGRLARLVECDALLLHGVTASVMQSTQWARNGAPIATQ